MPTSLASYFAFARPANRGGVRTRPTHAARACCQLSKGATLRQSHHFHLCQQTASSDFCLSPLAKPSGLERAPALEEARHNRTVPSRLCRQHGNHKPSAARVNAFGHTQAVKTGC
jgi:hypothetical protein